MIYDVKSSVNHLEKGNILKMANAYVRREGLRGWWYLGGAINDQAKVVLYEEKTSVLDNYCPQKLPPTSMYVRNLSVFSVPRHSR